MRSDLLIKTFDAGAAITKRRIVKVGAADNAVIQAAAATDQLLGVSVEVDVDSGESVDVVLEGVVDLEFGGIVARGGLVTSDTVGKGVAATASALDVPDQAVITGGVAGNHTVTGVAVGDEITAVIHNTAGALVDLTAEFTVDSADTIDNTGGTDTSADELLVFWRTPGAVGSRVIGVALQTTADGDIAQVRLAPGGA